MRVMGTTGGMKPALRWLGDVPGIEVDQLLVR